MSPIDPNSPAFPADPRITQYSGITIRALIAKDLMAALIAQGSDPACRAAIMEVAIQNNQTPNEVYAEMAIESTDALITQLNK